MAADVPSRLAGRIELVPDDAAPIASAPGPSFIFALGSQNHAPGA
jgi:hypothetical protein